MKQINVGLIGLGNIGSAAAECLRKNHAVIADNTGLDLRLKKVCDVRLRKTPYQFTRDPYEIINDPEISVVIEAIGGEKPALQYILGALKNGKHVVTPNKEVVAKHLKEILAVAGRSGARIRFEGAVGGGIPIIGPLMENLAANRLSEVYGIVNGTTNYILSRMTAEKSEFADALSEAKRLGYAEPDPSADIDGYDALYKSIILAAAAFGAEVNWRGVHVEGIRKITQEDIHYAGEIGYVIKLLAVARLIGGRIDVRVHPALVARLHPLAAVAKNFNAIYVKGSPVGELMFYGPGAGGNATASAIVGDIIFLANAVPAGRQNQCPMTNVKLRNYNLMGIEEVESRYYLRLQVADRPGVLAQIARVFARKNVSIDAVIQKETVGRTATLVILLHRVPEKNLNAALKIIARLPVVRRLGNVLRMV